MIDSKNKNPKYFIKTSNTVFSLNAKAISKKIMIEWARIEMSVDSKAEDYQKMKEDQNSLFWMCICFNFKETADFIMFNNPKIF